MKSHTAPQKVPLLSGLLCRMMSVHFLYVVFKGCGLVVTSQINWFSNGSVPSSAARSGRWRWTFPAGSWRWWTGRPWPPCSRWRTSGQRPRSGPADTARRWPRSPRILKTEKQIDLETIRQRRESRKYFLEANRMFQIASIDGEEVNICTCEAVRNKQWFYWINHQIYSFNRIGKQTISKPKRFKVCYSRIKSI